MEHPEDSALFSGKPINIKMPNIVMKFKTQKMDCWMKLTLNNIHEEELMLLSTFC